MIRGIKFGPRRKLSSGLQLKQLTTTTEIITEVEEVKAVTFEVATTVEVVEAE